MREKAKQCGEYSWTSCLSQEILSVDFFKESTTNAPNNRYDVRMFFDRYAIGLGISNEPIYEEMLSSLMTFVGILWNRRKGLLDSDSG